MFYCQFDKSLFFTYDFPHCYVFYCPNCKDKHKHTVPQTIISAVIETLISFILNFDSWLRGRYFYDVEEINTYAVWCTVIFYYSNCKDKHKLVTPQTIISEVIESVII